MKTRIISALVGTVILLAVLFCPYAWVFVVAAAVLSAIATWELLHNTGIMKNMGVCIGSMVFSLLSVLAVGAAENVSTMARPYYPLPAYALVPMVVLLLAAYGIFMSISWLVCRKCLGFAHFGKAFLLSAYATLGFASLAALRIEGVEAVILTLLIPWMSDTGAYFSGMLFGKHKMAPVISPKKTWEGFFGGWVFSIGCAALLAVIYNWIYYPTLHFYPGRYALIALVLAPLSVLGDLLASLIKRRCGIKDYGNIMPGHGGVMDRFDSVVLIAPLLYLLIWLLG